MKTSEKILKEALKLFSSRGYDAVGVQEIAEKAGVGKPSLYHFYKNKQGLLKAILDENYTLLFNCLDNFKIEDGEVINVFQEITREIFTFASENEHFYRLVLSLGFAPKKSIPYITVFPYFERQFKFFEGIFNEAGNYHSNLKGRDDIYSLTFMAHINTYIYLLLNDHFNITDNLVNRVVHQFMNGIFLCS